MLFAKLSELTEITIAAGCTASHSARFCRPWPIFLTGLFVGANQARAGMPAEQKSEYVLSQFNYFRCCGLDHHAFRHGGRARGRKTAHPLYLHNAQSTRTVRLKFGVAAKGRNINAGIVGGIKYLIPGAGFHVLAVYGQCYLTHSRTEDIV